MSADATTRQLERTWGQAPGLIGRLSAVQSRSIGFRYIVTGVSFLVLGGLAALLMRFQLAFPQNELIDAELYNQLFTVHGATMMFLFAVPIMEGIGIYFVPMMIGARDMAFPRLNAFGYWVYLIGGVALWVSLFAGQAPDAGWFNYPPLGSSQFQDPTRVDVYAGAISMLEVAALCAAIELVTTILKLRSPGMSLTRMPIFVWAQLVMALMIIVAMTTLLVATLLLELDNKIGTSFYLAAGGGDPLLWQHLFWYFGHPEVYIMLLPGLGIVATIVATFSRRRIVGYSFVVASFIAIGAASFGVWLHHMFVTGQPQAGASLFSVATFAIAVPSGIQIFATLATFRYGRLHLSVPLLYVFGFIFVFVMGGITGINVASIPIDTQVHDTYFVVAHFHYVLLGGVLLPLLGGLFYWFPKLTGRMLDSRLGVIAFWTQFVGINLTFFPMHLTGLEGMPRRVYTYLPGLGWDGLNLLSTVGAVVLGIGVALYVANLLVSLRGGATAPPNPWNAGTLEWSTASPPPAYVFRSAALVRGHHPLWGAEDAVPSDALVGEERLAMSIDRRETMGTSAFAGTPEQRVVLPGPTIVPLVAALAVGLGLIGMIFTIWLVPVSLVVVAVVVLGWWLGPQPAERDPAWLAAGPANSLPSSHVSAAYGIRSPSWWGALLTIVIALIAFGALFIAYLYLRLNNPEWPIEEVSPRGLIGPALVSVPLWLTPLVLFWAGRRLAAGSRAGAGVALLVVGALATTFGAGKVVEYAGLEYDATANASASIEWVIVGAHLLLVAVLVLGAVWLAVHLLRGAYPPERRTPFTALATFGTFVALIWVPGFLLVHLGPHVL